jgi:hypothetical protein
VHRAAQALEPASGKSYAIDFLELLNVELHPGLIVLREGGLSRKEQWARLEVARPCAEPA